jgi:hypothetical protein
MNPYYFTHGHGKETEGVIIPEILFCCIWQFAKIIDGTDTIGSQSGFLHLMAVVRDIEINPFDRFN